MKTVRLQLPVMDAEDVDDYLELVTEVPGVVAALVDHATATLDVAVSSAASALLVREGIVRSLMAGWAPVAC